MHKNEERSVLSISKFSINSEVNSLIKLKPYHQNVVKGRWVLKPIGDIRYSKSFIESEGTTNKTLVQPSQLSLDFYKKPLLKKNNVKIIRNTSSLNKFPVDFFNTSENINHEKGSYGQVLRSNDRYIDQ